MTEGSRGMVFRPCCSRSDPMRLVVPEEVTVVTAPRVALPVETLVSATGRPPDPVARPEHRTILGLCSTPRSVAELAALLKMPLGVARVLLGDLAATGSVSVHRTAGSAEAAPDVVLMQRVLTGLRRL